ncbi:MAG: hypothetical protein M3466_12795, partial [Gemmatimonadota bacterium]|nr:hypothetical protein [Gemmatimonadota bacterium]
DLKRLYNWISTNSKTAPVADSDGPYLDPSILAARQEKAHEAATSQSRGSRWLRKVLTDSQSPS